MQEIVSPLCQALFAVLMVGFWLEILAIYTVPDTISFSSLSLKVGVSE